MLEFLYILILLLFILSLFGYFIVILQEKINIKKNMVIIENKYLTLKDLDEIDISKFTLEGKNIKSGDEVKIFTSKKEKFRGILIGGNQKNDTVHIITFKNDVKKFKVDDIQNIKTTSKYGKFLNY